MLMWVVFTLFWCYCTLLFGGASFQWLSLLLGGVVYYWVCVSLGLVLLLVNVLSLSYDIFGTMGYLFVFLLAGACWGVASAGSVCNSGSCGAHISHFSSLGVGGAIGLVLPALELVSLLLRPITLGVRLATNISSGHVLLVLSGVVVGVLSGWLIAAVLVLILFEVFVGVLQGCIFSSLVVMYSEGE